MYTCVWPLQGIPFFYRWLVERYPLCSLPLTHDFVVPELDNLYLDMNGIVHQATHIDDLGDGALRPLLRAISPSATTTLLGCRLLTLHAAAPVVGVVFMSFVVTSDEQFASMIADLVMARVRELVLLTRPQRLLYVAIDGVAPRAKMNQQRSRRYKSAHERKKLAAKTSADAAAAGAPGEAPKQAYVKDSRFLNVLATWLPWCVAAAHASRLLLCEARCNSMQPCGTRCLTAESCSHAGCDAIVCRGVGVSEISCGRYVFDSNAITPGTVFMLALAARLEALLQAAAAIGSPGFANLTVRTASGLPAIPASPINVLAATACTCAHFVWLARQIVFSPSGVPGEGEHKMIDFMRRARMQCGEHSRAVEQRHCLYGADADLILLALATRERNIVILREVPCR
jgi:5'-3' exonuclease